jgi:hypothetical protein
MMGIVAAHFAVLSSSFITPTELRDFQLSVCWDGSWGSLGVVSYCPQLSYVTGRPAAEDLHLVVVDKIYRLFVHKKLLNAVYGRKPTIEKIGSKFEAQYDVHCLHLENNYIFGGIS